MRKLEFAIGDVHGELKLLLDLIKQIKQYSGQEHPAIYMLGDYVDRGPKSKQVIDFLMFNPWINCIKGNHEEMMLWAIQDPVSPAMQSWVRNGGVETMLSYSSEMELEAIPQVHINWLISLPTMIETEKRVYVDAGLLPGRPIDEQKDTAKLWIRDPFLTEDHDFGKHIVHGHTACQSVERRLNRTNLDTGACFGGHLSAGVFETDTREGPVDILRAFHNNQSVKGLWQN